MYLIKAKSSYIKLTLFIKYISLISQGIFKIFLPGGYTKNTPNPT